MDVAEDSMIDRVELRLFPRVREGRHLEAVEGLLGLDPAVLDVLAHRLGTAPRVEDEHASGFQ